MLPGLPHEQGALSSLRTFSALLPPTETAVPLTSLFLTSTLQVPPLCALLLKVLLVSSILSNSTDRSPPLSVSELKSWYTYLVAMKVQN